MGPHPGHHQTLILNPILSCLAGGRNKLLGAKAYDLYNAELDGTGLELNTPDIIWDVSHQDVPIGHRDWSSTTTHGRLYHIGTAPTRKLATYVTDLRFMVSGDELDVEAFPRGRISRARVRLMTDPLGDPVSTPVMVARGAQSGPVFGVTAAVHGTEVIGIPVIQRLFRTSIPRRWQARWPACPRSRCTRSSSPSGRSRRASTPTGSCPAAPRATSDRPTPTGF